MEFNPPIANAAGRGRLRFECVRGRTEIVESFAASPLKFLHPRSHSSAAWAVTSTYGGGLLGGDRIGISVEAGAGTRALLTTQASTKVYRSGLPSAQVLQCRVARGALFVSAPDRVSCFSGSSLRQTQSYQLEEGASLVALDWLSAGRLESGERWQFEHYSSRIEIRCGARAVLLDALLLDAAQSPIAARMRRFNTLATVAIAGPLVANGARELLERIGGSEIQTRAETCVAASPLGDDGALLRLAGTDVEALGAELRNALRFVVDLMGENPWARRW